MLTDSIADLLTRIRNAQRASHKSVEVRASRMAERVLGVLQKEGFIESFERVEKEASHPVINVVLRYFSSGRPMIAKARRVSRPGRRVYVSVDRLPRLDSGLGIAIVSTSQGVVSDREARSRKVGGEVLALVG